VDLTPALGCEWPQPRFLLEAGDLHFSMGGAVPNVGTALSRLGYPVRLAGLVGDDRLGAIAMQLLQPLGKQPMVPADFSKAFAGQRRSVCFGKHVVPWRTCRWNQYWVEAKT